MYQILVSFRVVPEHREAFLAAAHATARGALADEPGSLRFDVVADASDPDVVHLAETYRDAAAFEAHAQGSHFARFFETASAVADGPTWLMRGTVVVPEDAAA